MSLRYKIFFGYAILMAVIGSMAAILIYERQRMREIEAETANINLVRRGINTAHRRITGLATLGEGVVNWNKADYLYYRNHRLQADSLLNSLKRHCREYVRPEQIDTLRALLAEKETHLLHIMEMFERRTEADSVLVNQLPEVARRATHIRTIEQKKKGIAGFFGKKEEIQVMPSQKELHDFSDSLIAIHQRQANEMDIYADSLRMRNRELNRTLNKLINDLDEQAQTAFSQRELKMAEAEKMSFFLMAGVIGMAIILLIISHLIIMRDLNRRERDKAELEDTATQNRTLSDMRKKIIITLSHDIRGPLNAISGSAELAMDTRDRKRRNAYLGNILESSRHITRLANSLLDLSRLDDAKETLNEIPFHLESFLESIAEEYTRKANDKGLMFDKAFMGCGITVLGDADRYIQAGFAGCIHKPFYTRDLLEFLSSLIGQDRTMDNHSPDFEALYVTTGDERWTLETLIEESNRNSSDLLDSLSQEKLDRKRIWETLHRMYPMWEQLGIAHELESYSYEEYVEDTDESAFRNDVERIVRRIDRLISETKSRLS